MRKSQIWPNHLRFSGAVCAALFLVVSCSHSDTHVSSAGPYYYCSARSDVRGQTLVVTEQVFPFDGPISSFPSKAPALQASFAAYADSIWRMTITPTCTPALSESAAEMARRAEVGRYEDQGDAIWRVSFWHPA